MSSIYNVIENAMTNHGMWSELLHAFMCVSCMIFTLSMITTGLWDYSMDKNSRVLMSKFITIVISLMIAIGGIWSTLSSGLAWGFAWRGFFVCLISGSGFSLIGILRKTFNFAKYE